MKLKDLIPPEKLPKEKEEVIPKHKWGIRAFDKNVGFNACKAMYDELEIEFDWETTIEFIANHLTEESTNGECCLPDLTQESRARMIGRADKIVKAIASSLSKIVEIK